MKSERASKGRRLQVALSNKVKSLGFRTCPGWRKIYINGLGIGKDHWELVVKREKF